MEIKSSTSTLVRNKKSTRKDNGSSEPMRKKHIVICKVKYDDKVDRNIDDDKVTGLQNEDDGECIK